MSRKPHKKWGCPCTDCQKWYRDAIARHDALLRGLGYDKHERILKAMNHGDLALRAQDQAEAGPTYRECECGALVACWSESMIEAVKRDAAKLREKFRPSPRATAEQNPGGSQPVDGEHVMQWIASAARETPRTDAYLTSLGAGDPSTHIALETMLVEFTRTLERELAEANRRLEELKAAHELGWAMRECPACGATGMLAAVKPEQEERK